MLKKIMYGDKIRNNEPEDSLELLDKRDYRTPCDINRPIENLYDEVEDIYLFLNSFGIYQLTDEGVFINSLSHEFKIHSNDVKKIELWDKRDSVNQNHVKKTYARLSPGIAGVYHKDGRQQSSIIINKPNVRFFERKVSEILGLFYHNEEELVEVRYNNVDQTFKSRVRMQTDREQPFFTFYFGCYDDISFYNQEYTGIKSLELIESMYNHDDFNSFFVDEIGLDIESLGLETFFEIKTIGKKYWIVENGKISLSDTNKGFFLSGFEVENLVDLNVINVDNNHIQYGTKVRIDIHGTTDDSFQVNTVGGAEINLKKDFFVENEAGAKLLLDRDKNLFLYNGDIVDVEFDDRVNFHNKVSNLTLEKSGRLVQGLTAENTINSGSKNEEVTGDVTIKASGNKTETVIKDYNVNVTKNHNVTITEDLNEVVKKNYKRNTTINETIDVGGFSLETVVGDKTTSAKTQNIKAAESLTIESPAIVFDAGENGTITFIGKNQIIEGDTVRLGDNIIELNKNQKGIPVTTLVSGISINRGTSPTSNIIFRESDDNWVCGLMDALKVVPTREENNTIVNSGIPSWDSANNIFKTDSKFFNNRDTGTLTVNVKPATVTTVPPISTNSTKVVANLNVDMVDDVHINKSGALVNEVVMWESANTMKTTKKTIKSAIVDSDNDLPTSGAVMKYYHSMVKYGISNFAGNSSGRLVYHELSSVPTAIQITPASDASGYIGEFWVDSRTSTSFTVYNSGSAVSSFFWTAFK